MIIYMWWCFGGWYLLCGIGVIFLIVVILRLVVCSVWIVVLWFELGFLIVIFNVFKLCFCVDFVVFLVVICVVKGVDLWEFLNFREFVFD